MIAMKLPTMRLPTMRLPTMRLPTMRNPTMRPPHNNSGKGPKGNKLWKTIAPKSESIEKWKLV
jgi:hypothetical protein